MDLRIGCIIFVGVFVFLIFWNASHEKKKKKEKKEKEKREMKLKINRTSEFQTVFNNFLSHLHFIWITNRRKIKISLNEKLIFTTSWSGKLWRVENLENTLKTSGKLLW